MHKKIPRKTATDGCLSTGVIAGLTHQPFSCFSSSSTKKMATPSARRRRWEELGKDLLVTIFSNLDVADLVAGASRTCSSWRGASKDPVLWRAKSLDFGCFHRSILPLHNLGCVLRVAVARGGACLETIRFPCCADGADLLYVAERCPKLCYFYMENADVSEHQFCEAIGKLEFLKGMAVNEILIHEHVLELVGKSCSHFSELKIIAERIDANMALVICNTLPHLRRLELNDCEISPRALHFFLDDLKDLEYLDISMSGQKLVGVPSTILEKASRLKVFLWDSEIDEVKFGCCSEQT